MRHRSTLRPGDAGLAARLRREIEGEVWFDPASRGRYSTDASIYQIEPIGVVAPRTAGDIAQAIAVCREAGAPVLPRGAGTSQCGQTVGEAVVVDTSKYLDRVIGFDAEAQRVTVQPGIVLDRLNAWLEPKGLFFPVDVSPANRATIGGMAGNNSCGARSIRYGNMVHNVHAISAILADGTTARFAEAPGNLAGITGDDRYCDLIRRMRTLGAREAGEIARRFPPLLRRVGGYNIDTLADGGAAGDRTGSAARRAPGGNNFDTLAASSATGDRTGDAARGTLGGNNIDNLTTSGAADDRTGAAARRAPGGNNMAHLLVGSEGTLGFFTEIELDLQPLPTHRVLGVCHFPAFYKAMSATQHIVALDPSAVELVDRTLIELARDIDVFRPTIERFVRGTPDALLLVEFAGEDRGALLARLAQLGVLMADLGFPGAVGRGGRAIVPARGVGRAQGGPQHHDVDEGRRETRLLRGGLRSAARGPRRVHPPPRRHLRPPRDPRYLVRPRLGRHSARAPDHRSEGCGRGAHHAGHRRGVLRDGPRVQGLALRRARRRHRAQRVPRGDVRHPARLRIRGGQGRLRPGRPVQSGQDREA